MGSGKTEALFEQIKADKQSNYIYVTPYIEEINRAIASTHRRFIQPLNYGQGKLNDLHRLLSSGCDIATTHALLLRVTQETMQLIHEGGYILVLDETLDIFREYNEVVKELDGKVVNKETVQWLKQEDVIRIDSSYKATWNSSVVPEFGFSEIVRMANEGCLRCVDDVLFWEFPADIFSAFNKVYILTYQFQGTQFDSYMQMHGLDYSLVSAHINNLGKYELCQYDNCIDIRKQKIDEINIYEGPLNDIGLKNNAFSVNQLKEMSSKEVQKIKNAMRSYKYMVKAPAESIMWTSSMSGDFYKKLEQTKGFKYIRRLSGSEMSLSEQELRKLKCFVSCNARATNSFSKTEISRDGGKLVCSERYNLLYLLNRFLPPEIKKYFSAQGYSLDEDVFATNELIQWIWRSRIRNDKPINLYIPSSRMRELLYRWGGLEPTWNQTLEKQA